MKRFYIIDSHGNVITANKPVVEAKENAAADREYK